MNKLFCPALKLTLFTDLTDDLTCVILGMLSWILILEQMEYKKCIFVVVSVHRYKFTQLWQLTLLKSVHISSGRNSLNTIWRGPSQCLLFMGPINHNSGAPTIRQQKQGADMYVGGLAIWFLDSSGLLLRRFKAVTRLFLNGCLLKNLPHSHSPVGSAKKSNKNRVTFWAIVKVMFRFAGTKAEKMAYFPSFRSMLSSSFFRQNRNVPNSVYT